MQSQGRPTLISIVIWSIVASLMTGCGGGGGGPVAQRITITAKLPADGAAETVASAWVDRFIA